MGYSKRWLNSVIDYIVSFSPLDMGRASTLVKRELEYIENEVSAIEDHSLMKACMIAMRQPLPLFLASPAVSSSGTDGIPLHGRQGTPEDIVLRLKEAGFLHEGLTAADIFPPAALTSTSQISFEAAAGSGMGRHHAYPGGLVVHVASNLRRCLDQARAYGDIYGIKLRRDILVAACIFHDCMKPYALQWMPNGLPCPEAMIAGEGAHHVMSLAQTIAIGVDPMTLTAAASAPRDPGQARGEVASFIAAACLLAGVEPEQSGAVFNACISDGGNQAGCMQPGNPYPKAGAWSLSYPGLVEYWLIYLSDSDYALTNSAASTVESAFSHLAVEQYGFSHSDLASPRFRQFRNFVFSQLSSEYLYWKLTVYGKDAFREDIDKTIRQVCMMNLI
ncbi:MAG TPA: hypothetical protein GX506_04280 [Firmicutes bacterium]|nr:hypothetical protein [Bacillota bacterium]